MEDDFSLLIAANGRRQSESGAVLPLMAIILVGILSLLMIFGLDSVLTRASSTDLKRVVDSVCTRTVKYGVTPGRAVEIFRTELARAISQNQLPRFVPLEAHLIIPTWDPSASGQSPFVESPISFKELVPQDWCEDPDRCCTFLPSGTDCTFHGDVSLEGGSYQDDFLEARFPKWEGFWRNDKDQSTAIGCEVIGKTRSFDLFASSSEQDANVLSARTVVARAIASPGDSPSEGLTIIIAPQMTTSGSDPRFRFSRAIEDDQPGFQTRFDPVWSHAWNAVAGGPLYSTRPEDPSLPGFLYPSSAPESDTYTIQSGSWQLFRPPAMASLLRSGPGNSGGQTRNYDGQSTFFVEDHGEATEAQGLILSQREERMYACMNPAILVRNLFLQSLVEFAARTGNLRRSTEILVANPYSRQVSSRNSVPDSAKWQAATVVVPFGADLTQRAYQLPFVFFDGGVDGAVPADFGPFRGIVNPFQTQAESTRPIHALIARQLRDCYHLYHLDTIQDGYPLRGLHRPDLTDRFDGVGFSYPGGFSAETPYRYHAVLYENQGPLLAMHDQGCPWNPPEFQGACGTAPLGNRALNAAELVSILGSVQSAPAPFTLESGTSFEKFWPLQSGLDEPTDAPRELRGDLLGALSALLRTDSGGPLAGKAIPSPGIFPSMTVDGKPELKSVGAPASAKTHVVLVLSQRISNSEKDAIRTLFRSYPELRDRGMTIVYIPTNSVDASDEAISRIGDAFYVGELIRAGMMVGMPESVSGRVLLVLSPYASRYSSNPNYHFIDIDPHLEWKDFRHYWNDQITSPTDNPYVAALDLFSDRILASGMKF